jgi:nuclease-like protein
MIKIVDKTPLVDEKGNLAFMQRIQGMLEYGFNWPRELEAQRAIVRFFDNNLEKNFTLIRNMPLGQSGIVVPMILLGPPGIYVLEVTHLRGRYQASGDSWNVESGNGYAPAPVNLIKRTVRMADALHAFIERQGVRIPVTIDPVIIAGDPGLHIESARPAIKVMMIDGIKAFVNGLANASPVLSTIQVNDFVDRILNPRPKMEAPPPVSEPEPESQPRAAWEDMYSWNEEPEQQQQPESSRAQASFDASKDAQSFNPNDYGFAMEEGAQAEDIPPVAREASPAQPVRQAQAKSQKILGMTPFQLAVIAVLAVMLLCILAAFVYVIVNQ